MYTRVHVLLMHVFNMHNYYVYIQEFCIRKLPLAWKKISLLGSNPCPREPLMICSADFSKSFPRYACVPFIEYLQSTSAGRMPIDQHHTFGASPSHLLVAEVLWQIPASPVQVRILGLFAGPKITNSHRRPGSGPPPNQLSVGFFSYK